MMTLMMFSIPSSYSSWVISEDTNWIWVAQSDILQMQMMKWTSLPAAYEWNEDSENWELLLTTI